MEKLHDKQKIVENEIFILLVRTQIHDDLIKPEIVRIVCN